MWIGYIINLVTLLADKKSKALDTKLVPPSIIKNTDWQCFRTTHITLPESEYIIYTCIHNHKKN